MSSDNIAGIETGPTGFCSLLSITHCSQSTIPDAGPSDATSGGGVTPIMQRKKAASLNIFLVIGQEEGTINDGAHGLAGSLNLVDNGFSQRFMTTLMESISIL